jgi:hypothetical protein
VDVRFINWKSCAVPWRNFNPWWIVQRPCYLIPAQARQLLLAPEAYA